MLADRTNTMERPAKKSKKTVEDTYKKVDQIEHVLLRPDTYIGSVEKETDNLWVIDDSVTPAQMSLQSIEFVPGLYKIYDEIIVNAADNKVRDPSMKKIKIDIDVENNQISVWNDGSGLPVETHQEHKMYVPELVFGHLLTSSNFDDEEEKVTGGRNGYGAKLTNIYSSKFTIETVDSDRGKKYEQTWHNNMSKKDPHKITSTSKSSFTQVTFKPDLKRFKLNSLEPMLPLLKKRAYDLAACSTGGLSVELNGKKVPVKDFKQYISLYPGVEGQIGTCLFETECKRWTVCVVGSTIGHQQVSFVNSINTFKGGKHVDYIAEQVIKVVQQNAAKKKIEVKPAQARAHMWVFLKCLIVNPSFDSQTKGNLTTNRTRFGSKCEIPEKTKKNISKCIIEPIMEDACAKASKVMNMKVKKTRKKLDVPKLVPANEAGGTNAHKCTLILTEGDSAKGLAVAGLSIVGRDYYGVFPLKGKPLNVRDVPASQLKKNAEFKNIMQIMGMELGKKYTSTQGLNYGRLMIMADQDHDGSHIKGLLLNFIHSLFPSLLQIPGFVVEFITPIVKARKKKSSGSNEGDVKSFFSIPEYQKWFETQGANIKEWDIKYYKGLGTSSPQEGKEYFSDLGKHRIVFDYKDADDNNSIVLAFDKSKADDRKSWLTNYEDGVCVDHNNKHLKITDFVNKELILFSRADCERSIPNVVDGFKPSQRKILFSCFKKGSLHRSDIKVAQLSGYVSEHSAYHHGEVSLQGAIVNMAQDFVGHHNLNFLQPKGIFGSRAVGGKDHAQARYIFTQLTPVARAMFPEVDDEILTYKDDDGVSVEPEWYAPVIPMILVNGSKGIGTGFSTTIPNHNPDDLINRMRAMIKGEETQPLLPWYRGFIGEIKQANTERDAFTIVGKVRRIGRNIVNITELPIGTWTEDYQRHFIHQLYENEVINDYREHHSDVNVDFEIMMDESILDEWEAAGLTKKFKLETQVSYTNMHCFDKHGRIYKYAGVDDICKEFYTLRVDLYKKRKQHLVDKVTNDIEKLKNMVRFIVEVIDGKMKVMKRKKQQLIKDLMDANYKGFPPQKSKKKAKHAVDNEEKKEGDDEDDDNDDDENSLKYKYLYSMPIYSLTYEKLERMKKQLADKEKELETLLNTGPKDMWLADLKKLEEVSRAWEQKRLKMQKESMEKTQKKARKTERLVQCHFTEKKLRITDKGKAFLEAEKKKKPKTTRDPKAEPKPKVKREKKVKTESDLEDDIKREAMSSDDEPIAKKRKTTPSTSVAVKKEKKEKKVGAGFNKGLLDSSSDENFDHLFSETKKSPPKKKTLVPSIFTKDKKTTAKKKESTLFDDEDSDEAGLFSPPKKSSKTTTKPKSRKKALESDDDSDDESDGLLFDCDSPPVRQKPRPARAARTGATKSYKDHDSGSSEGEDVECVESSDASDEFVCSD